MNLFYLGRKGIDHHIDEFVQILKEKYNITAELLKPMNGWESYYINLEAPEAINLFCVEGTPILQEHKGTDVLYDGNIFFITDTEHNNAIVIAGDTKISLNPTTLQNGPCKQWQDTIIYALKQYIKNRGFYSTIANWKLPIFSGYSSGKKINAAKGLVEVLERSKTNPEIQEIPQEILEPIAEKNSNLNKAITAAMAWHNDAKHPFFTDSELFKKLRSFVEDSVPISKQDCH